MGIGAALTCVLWFRGIARMESAVVSLLLFLSPVTAVLLGWILRNEALSSLQIVGVIFVVSSIWLGQRAGTTLVPVPRNR
jgi:probable blue pigment (indigoidine) exporter